MQEKWYVPSGLWAQHRSTIAGMARRAGLNCIRLVWSTEMALRSANGSIGVPTAALYANPDLQGKGPLQVLDAVIAAIAQQGLMVILDNHSSDAMWCCEITDGNGLWYTARWSEAHWLQGWAVMAQRYAKTAAVVGMGLRNEPRPTFLNYQLRLPSWGSGGALTDLTVAYEKAAAVVLAAKPRSLIFAQGVLAGRDLRGVRARPLVLRSAWPLGQVVGNQLVYEVHEYPFLWGNFNFSDHAAYAARLDASWGFIFKEGRAPVWLGEFGVQHTAAGISSPWWKAVTRYIRDNSLDWAYWPLDGQQGPSRKQGEVETYGLLNPSWNGWAYAPLVAELAALV
uniref:Glycoside hydrolase family 5 domain-containing protein n=1 Tax=Tetradesmus obliquus TaxID=3088 RepID=A0A383WF09_TETOB|eukprot:jgi/Sobl393_1/9267/SZX75833.1